MYERSYSNQYGRYFDNSTDEYHSLHKVNVFYLLEFSRYCLKVWKKISIKEWCNKTLFFLVKCFVNRYVPL